MEEAAAVVKTEPSSGSASRAAVNLEKRWEEKVVGMFVKKEERSPAVAKGDAGPSSSASSAETASHPASSSTETTTTATEQKSATRVSGPSTAAPSAPLVDSRGPGNLTALHYASEFGHTEVVQVLLKEGRAKWDCTDAVGKTPLHRAVAQGHAECASALVQAALEADRRTRSQETAAMRTFAVCWFRATTKDMSRKAGAGKCSKPSDEPPLSHRRHPRIPCSCERCELGRAAAALLRVRDFALSPSKVSAFVNQFDTPTPGGSVSPVTPLMGAAAAGRTECVQLLLEAKAFPLLSDVHGYTALDFSSAAAAAAAVAASAYPAPTATGPAGSLGLNRYQAAKDLLTAWVHPPLCPSRLTSTGACSSLVAAASHHPGAFGRRSSTDHVAAPARHSCTPDYCVSFLLRAKASPVLPAEAAPLSICPVGAAIEAENTSALRCLLAAKASVSNGNGESLLPQACSAKNIEMARLLCEAKADVNCSGPVVSPSNASRAGSTAAADASAASAASASPCKRPSVARLVTRCTPLVAAAKANDAAVARHLIAAKASITLSVVESRDVKLQAWLQQLDRPPVVISSAVQPTVPSRKRKVAPSNNTSLSPTGLPVASPPPVGGVDATLEGVAKRAKRQLDNSDLGGTEASSRALLLVDSSLPAAEWAGFSDEDDVISEALDSLGGPLDIGDSTEDDDFDLCAHMSFGSTDSDWRQRQLDKTEDMLDLSTKPEMFLSSSTPPLLV